MLLCYLIFSIIFSTTLWADDIAPITQDAVPSATKPIPAFTLEQRTERYIKRTYSPDRLITMSANIAFNNYLMGDAKKWGRGPGDYRDAVAISFGQRFITNTTDLLVGALIGDDDIYRPSTDKRLTRRIGHAVFGAFTAQSRSGKTIPAYSRFIAVSTGIAISNQLTPHPENTPDVAWSIASSLTDKITNDMWDEFHVSNHLFRIGKKSRDGAFRILYKLTFPKN